MSSHLRVFFGIPLGSPKKIKGLGEDDLDIYIEKQGRNNRLGPRSEGRACSTSTAALKMAPWSSASTWAA